MGERMGFRLPSALAGDDNEVTMDEEGARTVAELIAGVAGGLGIVTAGVMIYRKFANMAGQDNLGDLY